MEGNTKKAKKGVICGLSEEITHLVLISVPTP